MSGHSVIVRQPSVTSHCAWSTTMLLEPHAEGTVLRVRVHPGARRNGIEGVQEGELKVSVTAAAEKSKANQALIALLARQLSLRKGQIELIAGETARHKRVLVRAVSRQELADRIAGFTGQTA